MDLHLVSTLAFGPSDVGLASTGTSPLVPVLTCVLPFGSATLGVTTFGSATPDVTMFWGVMTPGVLFLIVVTPCVSPCIFATTIVSIPGFVTAGVLTFAIATTGVSAPAAIAPEVWVCAGLPDVSETCCEFAAGAVAELVRPAAIGDLGGKLPVTRVACDVERVDRPPAAGVCEEHPDAVVWDEPVVEGVDEEPVVEGVDEEPVWSSPSSLIFRNVVIVRLSA